MDMMNGEASNEKRVIFRPFIEKLEHTMRTAWASEKSRGLATFV